jgi:hypothetical protein
MIAVGVFSWCENRWLRSSRPSLFDSGPSATATAAAGHRPTATSAASASAAAAAAAVGSGYDEGEQLAALAAAAWQQYVVGRGATAMGVSVLIELSVEACRCTTPLSVSLCSILFHLSI